jgi:Lrp/AsnC family transcriptional regulator for asnA, asnC and gidA
MKSNKSRAGEVRLSAADAQIIRCLNEDARSSAAAIAERLKLPESTVRYRLGRLVKTGVIEFTAVPNPLHLGYQTWAILEIHAELARLRDIARELASRPEVYFVSITTGNYDILVGAVFRSNEEMLEFITAYLPRLPGIVRTTTSTVLEVVKRFLTFPVPGGEEDPAARTPERRRARKPAASKGKPRSR